MEFGIGAGVEMGVTATETITIRNVGDDPLVVSDVYLSRPISDEFAFTDKTTFTLATGESTTVDVSYTPANSALDSGELVSQLVDHGRAEGIRRGGPPGQPRRRGMARHRQERLGRVYPGDLRRSQDPDDRTHLDRAGHRGRHLPRPDHGLLQGMGR